MSVYLEVWPGGRVSISSTDESGGGHGYRIAGSKFSLLPADSRPIVKHEITERDATEIRRYLNEVTS